MRDLRRGLWALCGAALWAASALCAEEITQDALDRLPAADVIVLGEVHDNPVHHANQARAVAAIRPRALVFEMLTPDQAAHLPQDRSDAATVERALGWEAAGWPDFAMYHPIFLAAPKARVFGGDVPQADLLRAMATRAATVFGPGAVRFGLMARLAPGDQAAREAEMRAAHCNALPEELLPGMVEVQRLRDATLARSVLKAINATGGPVVVITGSGHARRDRGVPAVLHLAAPQLSVLSIGQIDGPWRQLPPFDLWLLTPGGAPGDPCAAFGTETALPQRPIAAG